MTTSKSVLVIGLVLFEKLINVVREHAPQARICFNTLPSDTAAAVTRWL